MFGEHDFDSVAFALLCGEWRIAQWHFRDWLCAYRRFVPANAREQALWCFFHPLAHIVTACLSFVLGCVWRCVCSRRLRLRELRPVTKPDWDDRVELYQFLVLLLLRMVFIWMVLMILIEWIRVGIFAPFSLRVCNGL